METLHHITVARINNYYYFEYLRLWHVFKFKFWSAKNDVLLIV